MTNAELKRRRKVMADAHRGIADLFEATSDKKFNAIKAELQKDKELDFEVSIIWEAMAQHMLEARKKLGKLWQTNS